jgi:biotin synthase
MCLSVPGKVIKIEGQWAIVQSEDHTHRADLSLVKDVKIGDYLLVHNDLALNKVPKGDAQKILKFLEKFQNSREDHHHFDAKFQKIIEDSRVRNLTRDEVIYLLQTEGSEKEFLFNEANKRRQEYLKEFICIHGIIEFSNYCKNDCLYCGLRKENKELKRYRMKPEEIVKVAEKAVKQKGYKLLVLQSGEDYFYSDEMLAEIIRKIKGKCRVFIFVSVGERGYEAYKKMKEAGASGVLFRFETSNPELFRKMHPQGKDFKNRFEHLKFMKELGYFIATGSLIGLPGQTIEDLADDVFMMKKWANMVSMGPFVPTKNTPLANEPAGDPEINLKMIAILRLLMPYSRIPVVTAFETLAGGEEGRRRALFSGANSLMFNLTPAKYRPYYKIYGDKFFQKENFWEKYGLFKYEESYQMLEERMARELKK